MYLFNIQISPRKKLFFRAHSANKILKRELSRRNLREISRKFAQTIQKLRENSGVISKNEGLSSVVPYPSSVIVASNVVTKNSRPTSFNIPLKAL